MAQKFKHPWWLPGKIKPVFDAYFSDL